LFSALESRCKKLKTHSKASSLPAASRQLLAPFYVGLVGAIALLLFKFVKEFINLLPVVVNGEAARSWQACSPWWMWRWWPTCSSSSSSLATGLRRIGCAVRVMDRLTKSPGH